LPNDEIDRPKTFGFKLEDRLSLNRRDAAVPTFETVMTVARIGLEIKIYKD
jgi:hypothetical protein